MGKIIKLTNDILEVEISTLGAETLSVKKYGEDKMWCGSEKFFKGFSPILFPYCSSLRDGIAIFEGKTFKNLPKHGFACTQEFEVISQEKSSVCLLLKDNDYTKTIYPYSFNFKVLFKLLGEKLGVYYIVENTGNTKLPFNVGSHETYRVEETIESYYLEFSSDSDYIESTCIKNQLLGDEKFKIQLNANKLPLDYKYFHRTDNFDSKTLKNGSLIFENINSKRVNLVKKDSEEVVVSVYFNDFSHLVLWTPVNAPFIAIEAWSGLPDTYNANYNIEDKKSIEFIEIGGAKTLYHSIEF